METTRNMARIPPWVKVHVRSMRDAWNTGFVCMANYRRNTHCVGVIVGNKGIYCIGLYRD